ncbi:P60-like protein [Terfezia boudieri ATCC MYA-4762]|uniref:Ribosome biogenesis protein NOP53 n=1 Tax=Terfezia boudieri ATCC MYA-4762 TaxID=1051890 RepID=A0A3N4MA93_9PEZI|nr:P60-like protein [Terfezia boudieri ATCC MYA-4762]
MSSGPPAAYKQPSRKGKKAWRKNVDVTKFNAGLEELRAEIIAGGVITEKPNDQLFSLDLSGDKGIVTRELKKQKLLKADEILTSRSAVPAVSSRKRYHDDDNNSSYNTVTDGVITSPKKKKKDYIPHKELQKLKKIAYGGTEVAVAKTQAVKLHDPWAEPVQEGEVVDPKFSFLDKEKEIKAPKTMKIAPVSLSATGKKLPAVKVPEGGISYNPHFEEWDDLLRKEGDKEVGAEKKRLKEEAEERERLARIAQIEAEELAKAAAGEEEEEEDNLEGDEGLKETFTKPRAVRKNRVQRNKEARLKEQALLKARLQQQKRQRQELENLRTIKLSIEAKEAARLEALAVTADEAGDSEKAEKIRRRKLGKAHLPPKPLELQLPSELSDCLRRLKPEGNLLKDRFRSFMERGILETRVMPVIAKKRKVTESEKWSYKDFR